MAVFQRLPPLMLPFVILVAWTWTLSLAAAVVFVVPVLLLVPRLRRPPVWIAAVWGAMAAWAFAAAVGPLWGSLAGAASGGLYALPVRRVSATG